MIIQKYRCDGCGIEADGHIVPEGWVARINLSTGNDGYCTLFLKNQSWKHYCTKCETKYEMEQAEGNIQKMFDEEMKNS